MTLEDQKYYEALFATFATPGWALIVEKWEEVEANKNSAKTIVDGGLEYRKGELSMINWMLRFEEDHRTAYEELI